MYLYYKRTNERTELHQFRKEVAMMVIYLPVKFEFDCFSQEESVAGLMSEVSPFLKEIKRRDQSK